MKKIFFLPLILFFVFDSCKELADGDISKITIINNSSHKILVSKSYSYPDTSLSNISSVCEMILPTMTCDAMSLHGWKGDINSNTKGVIIFFFSDIDTIEKYGADVSLKEYKILKRYELTQTDLEKSNWTITYP